MTYPRLTMAAMTAAALATMATTATSTTIAKCITPEQGSGQRVSVTFLNFPERAVDVAWTATAPGWSMTGVQSFSSGTTTFALAVPDGTRVVDISSTWGPDPVRDSYRVQVDALCEPPPPPVPPVAPEPPAKPPAVTPPAKPPVKPRPKWNCQNLPRGAGINWRVRLGCVKPKPPKKVTPPRKACPPRYRLRGVVITRRVDGRVIKRRVFTCIPPARPAPNPTG